MGYVDLDIDSFFSRSNLCVRCPLGNKAVWEAHFGRFLKTA